MAAAFMLGIMISAVMPDLVTAGPYDPKPQPKFCNCYDSYACGAPSPNCNYNPGWIARIGMNNCEIECGFEEVGCCAGDL